MVCESLTQVWSGWGLLVEVFWLRPTGRRPWDRNRTHCGNYIYIGIKDVTKSDFEMNDVSSWHCFPWPGSIDKPGRPANLNCILRSDHKVGTIEITHLSMHFNTRYKYKDPWIGCHDPDNVSSMCCPSLLFSDLPALSHSHLPLQR